MAAPSATGEFVYNLLSSGGSKARPNNTNYQKTVDERFQWLHAPGYMGPVNSQLAQASGSGVDHYIAPQAAIAHIRRIALTHGLYSAEKMLHPHHSSPERPATSA